MRVQNLPKLFLRNGSNFSEKQNNLTYNKLKIFQILNELNLIIHYDFKLQIFQNILNFNKRLKINWKASFPGTVFIRDYELR